MHLLNLSLLGTEVNLRSLPFLCLLLLTAFKELLLDLLKVLNTLVHVLDLTLVHLECFSGLFHRLRELIMLLFVVSEDLLQLFLFTLLDLGLLDVQDDLLLDLFLLRGDLLGHLILDGVLLRLLLRYLLVHQLALLIDLLDESLILCAKLSVLAGHITALLFGEALTVLADLQADLAEVRFEVGDDVLPLDFLGGDDSLMVFFECLVLVLVLACEDLILV